MAWSIFSSGQKYSPKSWAESMLKAGGWPTTAENTQSIIAWMLHEGGGGTYNPLNTTLTEPGATVLSGNPAGVKNYTSWGQGIQATVSTLQGSYYTDVVSALKSGKGLGSGTYSGLSTWSGGGYSNVSGTWSQAAQYMSGKAVPIAAGGGGGSSPGGQSWYSQILNFLGGAASGGTSGGLPGQEAGSIAGAISGGVAVLAKIEHFIEWWAAPSHWVRIFAGVGGGILVGFGLVNISRAGKPGAPQISLGPAGQVTVPMLSGDLAAALGIAEVALGSVGLFVAFHNLPSSVNDVPSLVAYLQGKISG